MLRTDVLSSGLRALAPYLLPHGDPSPPSPRVPASVLARTKMPFPDPPPQPSAVASLRALPIPPCVAMLLLQIDEACALWIANCLVAELGADFQIHQLLSYRPRLYLRVDGPRHDKELIPVPLCELPRAFDLRHSWKADVWRELLKKFEANVAIPGYLFGILRRVESALEHFFLSVSTLSPSSVEKPSAKADNVPPALAGILGSSSMQWLGKKVPEELLLHILRDLKISSGYDVPLTEIAQKDLLAQIVLSVCQEGVPPVIAVTQALTFLHLKPLGTCDGTIVQPEEMWMSVDRNSESFAVHAGSPVSKAAVISDICELITHVKIVLNSYLVAYQVRRMLYPDEERVMGGSWLDPRSIQNFTDSILAMYRRANGSVHLAALASILQQEWGQIRDGGNARLGSLADMLRRRGECLPGVLHTHRTTMVALTHSAPMVALSLSVRTLQDQMRSEQVGQKRVSDRAEDLSETATPVKVSKQGFPKVVDGNPDNPLECTRMTCDAESQCYFSHAHKPWNIDGQNPRYPKLPK